MLPAFFMHRTPAAASTHPPNQSNPKPVNLLNPVYKYLVNFFKILKYYLKSIKLPL